MSTAPEHAVERLQQIASTSTWNHGFAKRVTESVARIYGVSQSEMIGGCGERRVVMARQAAMWFIRKVGKYSLNRVGMCFGGRNHSTVINAIKMVEKRISDGSDPCIHQVVAALEE